MQSFNIICHTCALLICIAVAVDAQLKTKRQIYREQVLPLSGGKIPEDAFRADRLALNRLNKEGISVPDGLLLEHRNVHSHPHENKHDPEDEDSVIKIIQQPETRYAPEEGRYHNEQPLTVPSTYLIRKPIGREETNILPPDQQRPFHQSLYYKQNPGAQFRPISRPSNQHAGGYTTHAPQRPVAHSQSYYHPHISPPKAYHPIPVPFELPNREIQEERYFIKEQLNRGFSTEDISGTIQFPLLFSDFERLPSEYENHLSSDYNFEPQIHGFYRPEPFNSFGNFYASFNDRFSRKTSEGYAKGDERRVASTTKSEPVRTSKSYRKQIMCSKDIDSPSKCHICATFAVECQCGKCYFNAELKKKRIVRHCKKVHPITF